MYIKQATLWETDLEAKNHHNYLYIDEAFFCMVATSNSETR